MSSSAGLGAQIKEEHLTCSICLNAFRKPKALPCLHTFCELCLEDYVVSRGYESLGKFPCPLCRLNVTMPSLGVKSFPDNHLVSSLSDTVGHLQPHRPIPKPRRSLGQSGADSNQVGDPTSRAGLTGDPNTSNTTNINNSANSNSHEENRLPISSAKACTNDHTFDTECTPGPDDFEMVDKKKSAERTNELESSSESPPPYSLVADTHPDRDNAHRKVCSNDTDSSWMVVPSQRTNHGPGIDQGNCDQRSNFSQSNIAHSSHTPHYNSGNTAHFSNPIPQRTSNHPQAPIGWNVNAPYPPQPVAGIPNNHQAHSQPQQYPGQSQGQNNASQPSSSALYPNVPMEQGQVTACAEMLMLRFGKQGSTARDFIKPIGLAVSCEGHYIVSDNGGDQNRLLVFNSSGEITTAFKCGCKVKDIGITQKNEIVAAIHKANNAIRRFTIGGQLKGEYGKFFTYEEPSGVAELTNGGIVLTGVNGHCAYVLSDQMKLQTKFGRKGNGDGYFSHPGFVAVDSKNHIVISDKVNGCIQTFNAEGKFKQRFGSIGSKHGQLEAPMGVCVDSADNIIVADSGNFRVEAFSSRGRYLSTVVRDTWQMGENVRPVNVAMTPTGRVAVLLRGPYFAEVRVYSSKHQDIPIEVGPPSVSLPLPQGFSIPMPKNFGWPS